MICIWATPRPFTGRTTTATTTTVDPFNFFGLFFGGGGNDDDEATIAPRSGTIPLSHLLFLSHLCHKSHNHSLVHYLFSILCAAVDATSTDFVELIPEITTVSGNGITDSFIVAQFNESSRSDFVG